MTTGMRLASSLAWKPEDAGWDRYRKMRPSLRGRDIDFRRQIGQFHRSVRLSPLAWLKNVAAQLRKQ